MVNWFDALVLIILILGVWRGRKRGMSLELVDLIQWIVILFGCAFLYEPLGSTFAQMTSSGFLFSYVFTYLLIAVCFKLFFVMIKRSVGGKLVGSDVFGTAEYYLAMPAGMLCFACVLMMVLALLNARYFSPEEIAEDARFQNDVYGSRFFPGLNSLQSDVFDNSLSGGFIKRQLGFMLIKPTAPSRAKFKLKEFNTP